MQNLKKPLSSIVLLGVFLFGGCSMNMDILNSQKGNTQNNAKPQWLIDPNNGANGKLAATGCARIHYKGVSAQKKLAVQRAIDQIAMQKNTKVSVVNYRKKSVTNGKRGASSSNTNSLQEVDNINISTVVKAYYTKPNEEICAWVVEK